VTNLQRTTWRLAALALMGVAPISAAQAEQGTIIVKASVVKSLTLTKKQDLDFGTVTVSGTPGTYTVSMSLTGVLTCPSGATCAGAALPGIMNVQGSNSQVVRINVASGNLVNSVDGSTIPFTPIAPATVTLTNSGAPGKDFNIGGSIAIPSTADGTYAGNIVVTVDYQ
jgi:Mat/Ecp fimbriae major subunit